jgi:paraquat-inducible protein A
MTAFTAARVGLLPCQSCRLVSRPILGDDFACPGCGVRLHARKPDSLGRTTALLVAAVLLFVPANLLPIVTTTTLLRTHSETIVSGVVRLWNTGSWFLSILIFAASIVVPALKMAVLTLLVVSTRLRSLSTWRRAERTRLYRLVEMVGRWSMLDIFVMALMAALLQSPIASVEIRGGAIAFASVVVLTMFASMSFDPRLIWDASAPGKEDHRD